MLQQVQGLYGKFRVQRADTYAEVRDCFVLLPKDDLAARAAIKRYADYVADSNPDLARDLIEWLRQIRMEEYANDHPYR